MSGETRIIGVAGGRAVPLLQVDRIFGCDGWIIQLPAEASFDEKLTLTYCDSC